MIHSGKRILSLLSLVALFSCAHNGGRAPANHEGSDFNAQALGENAALLSWLQGKEKWASDWLSKRGTAGGPPDYIDYYLIDHPVSLDPPSAAQAQLAFNTKELYNRYFPKNDPSSSFGTFFECGHPWDKTSDPQAYQWNSLKISGMENPVLFDKAISQIVPSPQNQQRGIKSIRIAPNLWEVNLADPRSWNIFLRQIDTIWKHQATPTISVAFFPSLKKWETQLADQSGVDYSKSYLLNPHWPTDMGRLTSQMMVLLHQHALTYHRANPGLPLPRFAINPINEPETLAGFNRQFWHGAYANWGDPQTMRYYIPSIINIAKADVEIRLAAERKSYGERLLFMHNEAMTPFYYPSHHGVGRFAVSKFMLGDPVLMERDLNQDLKESLADLKSHLDLLEQNNQLNEVDWSLREYIFGSWNDSPEKQEQARQSLIAQLRDLQAEHRLLHQTFGKTMKTDTILQLDYYYQTEFVSNTPVPQLIEDLSANHGAKLKQALGYTTDDAFFAFVKTEAGSSDGPAPQIAISFPYNSLEQVDFKDLLSQEDFTMFERLLGMEMKYNLSEDPLARDRQTRAGLRSANGTAPVPPLNQTNQLLQDLTANDGEKLRAVLQLTSGQALTAAVAQAASDTSDGGPVVSVKEGEPLRDVLNRSQRTILNRLLGLQRSHSIGFFPIQYARQIRAGIRSGFYRFFLDYVNALGIRVAGVGESGTPFYIFAPLLHDQIMMEYASALRSGVMGTQYSPGPLVDTRGWAKSPLALSYQEDHEINPSGIFRIDTSQGQVELKFRGDDQNSTSWLPQFMYPIQDSLRNSVQ